MTNAISVKDRLKNLQKDGITMQDALISYGLERTIFRISISEYAERFTLKGGIFLYALFDKHYARATRDIDLLAQSISNDKDEMKKVFTEIFSIETDDALRFDFDTLDVHDITEFKDYHGVNVSITAFLDRTKVPVSIDIGFDDVIYPERIRMDFPVLLDMEIPNIYAYTIYSVLAEKFEAIVSLGLANSRYKDFYDIYAIAIKYDLSGSELVQSIKETFEHRKTGYDDIVLFQDNFTSDPIRQSRWLSFIKKKKATLKISFTETIDFLKMFLSPVVNAIRLGESFEKQWNCGSREWS